MKRLIINLMVVCITQMLISASLMAQTQVSGVVMDETINEPLIGATVVIKGSTVGTITGIDGDFSLNAKSSDTLVFSFIGYLTKEVAVNDQTTINISLGPDNQNIDEVVVIGYGTQKKSHLTGSIAKLSSEGLDQIPVSRADQVLQGRMAGMSIKNVSGDVGSTPEIRVRGMGSISADNAPLIVVDGYPIPDDLSAIDMADVKSIEVLKDAASTAIYGSRGSNGVILITTKGGNENKPTYSFSAYTGIKTAVKTHDLYTMNEFYDNQRRFDQYNENVLAAEEGREPEIVSLSGKENTIVYLLDQIGETNYQDEAHRLGKTQSYKLSVSGGSKTSKYYISGSYLTEEGLLKDNDYDKFGLKAKIDATLSDRVKVGISVSPSYSKQRRSTVGLHDFARTYGWLPIYHNEFTSDQTGQPIGSYAHPRHFSAMPERDENGNLVLNNEGEPETENLWTSSQNNIVARRDNTFSYNSKYRFIGNAYVSIDIMKGLTFKSTVGGYVRSSVDEYFRNSEGYRTGIPEGYYRNVITTDLLSENYFTYNKELSGNHSISLLAGFSAQKNSEFDARLEGSNQPTDYIHTLNAAGEFSQSTEDTYTTKGETALLSYLGRISYAYADKYLLTISGRYDGSSLFGPENRWAAFPSASIGWKVSDEGFMEGADMVDILKLRASYGLSGNNDIENYAHTNTITSANYPFGSGVNSGLVNNNTTLANKFITWERTYESNFGLDLSMYNDRFTVALDYYYAITDQLLLEKNIPAHSGATNEWANIGKVRNKGYEIEVKGYPIPSSSKFSWSVTANLSTNDNKLIDFGGAEQEITSAYRDHKYLAKVGEESIQFFGYKTDGIWASQEEIDAGPANAGATPGSLKYVDTNGDGVINDEDRVVLGSPFPDFNWGLTNTFKYKDFDLSFLFQGTYGNEVFNANGYYFEFLYLDKAYNSANQYVNSTYPGDGETPSTSSKANFLFTDYLVEDGSYVALRNLTLGYTLPKKHTERIKLKSLRVYASGQNLLYFMSKNYRGINPESVDDGDDYSSPLATGAQRGAQPIGRTIVFGLDIKF